MYGQNSGYEFQRIAENLGSASEKISWFNPTSYSHYMISTLRQAHHDLGWHYFFIKNDMPMAKQEFYLCGRTDEALQKYRQDSSVMSLSGANIFFSDTVDGHFHLMDVLLSDHQSLISRRTQLTYPERERYLFKEIYEQVVANELCHSFLRQDWQRFETVFLQLGKGKKAKNYAFDKLFFEGLRESNADKMREGIEGVASIKVHRARQKVNPEVGPWENVLLSMNGIAYTKLAWMHGYELDIKSPLVSIANALFPVKPLENYDEVYDFLKEDKAKRGLS